MKKSKLVHEAITAKGKYYSGVSFTKSGKVIGAGGNGSSGG